MDVVEVVRRLGGVASRAQLLTVVSRRQLEHAVAEGRLWRAGCVRYTELTLAGSRVLRFTWEQVMHHPDHLRGVLTALLDHDEPELRSFRDHDPRDLSA